MMDFLHSWCISVIWGENKLTFTWSSDNIILASILITVGVSTNNDGLSPSWNKSGNVGDNDWLSEDCTIKDVSNGSVWRFPHLLETEFLDSIFIRGNSGALNSDLAFFDSFGSINGNLIASCISALNA